MLAELVDAAVGIDIHPDRHEAEIALPSGAPIATCSISNDTAGHAELLAWIVDHARGPRLTVSVTPSWPGVVVRRPPEGASISASSTPPAVR